VITVAILINAQPIHARSAVNVTKVKKITEDTVCTYELDDGSRLRHRYGDGAVALAKRMLDTIKETK